MFIVRVYGLLFVACCELCVVGCWLLSNGVFDVWCFVCFNYYFLISFFVFAFWVLVVCCMLVDDCWLLLVIRCLSCVVCCVLFVVCCSLC